MEIRKVDMEKVHREIDAYVNSSSDIVKDDIAREHRTTDLIIDLSLQIDAREKNLPQRCVNQLVSIQGVLRMAIENVASTMNNDLLDSMAKGEKAHIEAYDVHKQELKMVTDRFYNDLKVSTNKHRSVWIILGPSDLERECVAAYHYYKADVALVNRTLTDTVDGILETEKAFKASCLSMSSEILKRCHKEYLIDYDIILDKYSN